MARDRSRMRERVKNKAKRSQEKSGNFNFNLPDKKKWFKPKAQTYNLDLIPYEVSVDYNKDCPKGELNDGLTVFIHRQIGDDKKDVICPKLNKGEDCPVCEYVSELKKDYDTNKNLIYSLKAKEISLFNVIDLKEDPDEILFFSTSPFKFTELLVEEILELPDDCEELDYFLPESGSTLKVRFKTSVFNDKGKEREFIQVSKIDFAKRREQYEDAIVDDAVDLDKCLKYYTYEQIESILFGTDVEEETIEQPPEEDVPKRRSKKFREEEVEEKPVVKKRAVKKKVEEDPEEDDDEPPFAVGDKEEPAPKARVRKRKAKVEEEPEEEKPVYDCIACSDTGLNSKGRPCRNCAPKKKEVKVDKDNKCKFGHVFGKDYQEFPDDCSQNCQEDDWDACSNLSEELEG